MGPIVADRQAMEYLMALCKEVKLGREQIRDAKPTSVRFRDDGA